MAIPSLHRFRTLCRSWLALVAGLLLAAPALAISMPTVSVTEVGGSTWSPSASTLGCGTPDATGAFSCTGSTSQILGGDATNVSWNLGLDPDPSVSNVIALTNNTASTQTYIITVSLPVSALSSPVTISGSVQGGFTDLNGNGATVTSAGSIPIYNALIDGVGVHGIYASSSFSAGAGHSANIPAVNFGPSLAFTPVNTSIGIQLEFTLTPGDTASFTSVFLVPEPGTLLLLLAAGVGLVAARRRVASAR